MGRKSNFLDKDVFRAVSMDMASAGMATLKSVSKASGVSIGSIYHRFGSREGLLAETWLAAIETFQSQFLAALCGEGQGAGLAAALVTPQFCRAHHDMALVLACCRPSEFIGDKAPEDLRGKIEEANIGIFAEVGKYAEQAGKPVDTCRLALIGLPLACVQLYLPKRAVPREADEYIRRVYPVLMGGEK